MGARGKTPAKTKKPAAAGHCRRVEQVAFDLGAGCVMAVARFDANGGGCGICS